MKNPTAVLVLWLVVAGVQGRAGIVGASAPATSNLPPRATLGMGGIVMQPERKASPRFTGSSLPLAPRQKSPWSVAGTPLPTNYISATRLLFEQGLADPRDASYRVIEVGTGSVWSGDAGVVQTHGWVLPGNPPGQFAICWNGLVYPVLSAGTNADLEADVSNVVTNGRASWRSVIPESESISPASLLGIKGCLLLRLGQIDLATRYWQAQLARSRDVPHTQAISNGVSTNGGVVLPRTDPYLGWATEWAWALFDRAICAHMRGDEALALVTARQLAQVQPQLEAAAASRGFPRPQSWESSAGKPKEKPYLDFLGQLPRLLADLERRAKEGPRVSVLERGLDSLTNQTERIAALIHDLDLVQARQWGQPGGINLPEDPIVSALIREGDPAVEPLLDCLESDQRLTRSVGFGRDFFPNRTVIPVSSAANSALLSILQAGFAGGAKEMRAYWNKYKGMDLNERCYAILRDDSARARWLEAAAHLTQPENVSTFPGGYSTLAPLPTNTPVRLRGEAMRTKSAPSVSELMARRALEIPEADPNSYELSAACEMALKLAAWDAKAAVPVLKTLSKRCATVVQYGGTGQGGLLTKLAVARGGAGDPDAFEEYAAWLPTTSPEQTAHSIMEYLAPLEKFPTNTVLQSAADKIFGNTNSAWGRLPWQKNGLNNPVSSGLVHVPAFRRLLERELDRREVCGTVTWQASGTVQFAITNYMSGSFGYTFPAAALTPNGTSAELRWCDWIALALSTGKHILPYNPFAPINQRDQALEGAKTWLRNQ